MQFKNRYICFVGILHSNQTVYYRKSWSLGDYWFCLEMPHCKETVSKVHDHFHMITFCPRDLLQDWEYKYIWIIPVRTNPMIIRSVHVRYPTSFNDKWCNSSFHSSFSCFKRKHFFSMFIGTWRRTLRSVCQRWCDSERRPSGRALRGTSEERSPGDEQEVVRDSGSKPFRFQRTSLCLTLQNIYLSIGHADSALSDIGQSKSEDCLMFP